MTKLRIFNALQGGFRLHLAAAALAGLAATACSSSSPPATTTVADGQGTGTDVKVTGDAGDTAAVTVTGTVGLVVDANRDGTADPANADDLKYGNTFDTTHGAVFLANVDDDNKDKARDCDNDTVDGDPDLLDLARAQVVAWPTAPDGTKATIKLDAMGAQNVRIFLHNTTDETWTAVAGELGACTGADDCIVTKSFDIPVELLRTGVELGIEGKRFRIDSTAADWDGSLKLTLGITDAAGKVVVGANTAADGLVKVVLHVAPWVLNGNLSPFDQVRSANYYGEFVADMKTALAAATLTYKTYNGWDDQWTQDFFQTAWTGMPGKDGKYQWMRIANARPWGRDQKGGDKDLPYYWLTKNYLGPDAGIIAIYLQPWSGSSYDSHGNHDLLPPYTNGTDNFPLGRIIHGSGILDETAAFYDAQLVQGPALEVNTSWLLVGHVDEIASYVPAKTDRGWKLLMASGKLCKTMYEQWVKDGNGDVKYWTGLKNYDPKTNAEKNAEITIAGTLADPDLMQWSQEAQTFVDGDHDQIATAVGLTEQEIIYIPFFTEDIADGGKKDDKIAWNPGTVNSLVTYNHMMIPNPFGPVINGKDVMAQDLLDRLGTAVNGLGSDGKGLQVHFVNDWAGYHVAEGEVHCASNPEGPPPTQTLWWQIKR